MFFRRWCYTDEASTEWEYCSPPGEVPHLCETFIFPADEYFHADIHIHADIYFHAYIDIFSQVLDTAYTVNGQDCIGECATQDEDYW